MKKKTKIFVLLLSLSVLFCLTATSCLSFLATVGGIIFNYSDHLSENRTIVYGNTNDLAVTFLDGKMLATWDYNAAFTYVLSVSDGSETKEFSSETGYVDLTDEGYAYTDELSLHLQKTRNLNTVSYDYNYDGLFPSDYEKYTAPVSAGFSEIDRYIATRAEWFDFFSYLIIFRDGVKENKEDDGSTSYLIETQCYFGYDYTDLPAYADLSADECMENEVCSAIDAYEDSASYAYSFSLERDKKTTTLYLKFYYPNQPSLETDTSERYQNATRLMDRPHYSTEVLHSRTFPIDQVEKTVSVKTSDQLYFALKKGYRPLPVSGSPADLIYTQMRTVLAYINSDRDTTYNKLHYIYDYIINTVIYDYVFTDETMKNGKSNDLFLYKCLYLEGVFGMQSNGTFDESKRVAICDGLSKAYMCMAVIEGIPCIKVSGTVSDEGHAWNKAKIGGNWYMIDTTWGNDLSKHSNLEYLSHEYFLVKDDAKHIENPYLNYPSAPSGYKETASGRMTFGSST